MRPAAAVVVALATEVLACMPPSGAEGIREDAHAAGLPRVARVNDASVGPAPRGLEVFVPTPDDNPLTLAGARLGERLFEDARLSRDGTKSCASCHLAGHAFGDSSAVSTGVGGRRGRRNAPPLVNRGYGRSFFRDGRSPTLEDAVLRPIQSVDELDMTLGEVVERLRADPFYRDAFAAAFRTPDFTEREMARALASFIRTLRSGDAPSDRWAAGDILALSPAARRGRQLFLGRANCSLCHAGPYFTDERFHNTGVSWGSGDAGRAAFTGVATDRGRFRTPGLRDVALTAPYMHDGSQATLDEVLDFYDRGGGANPLLDDRLEPLHLSRGERNDLRAFLVSLTGSRGG